MKKVIQIIIGNVLMAFAVSALILDHSIVVGGVSGISTVFHLSECNLCYNLTKKVKK